jgi:hypothetical protein
MDSLTLAKFLGGTGGRWLASQGCYHKFVNAAPGTGIISDVQTGFVATKALIVMQNTAPANSNVFCIPEYLKFLVTVVDASGAGASFQYAFAEDSILRYASGGTQVVLPGTYANNYGPTNALRIGPANIKSSGPQTAVFMGALTTAAESGNVVRVARGAIKQTAASPVAAVNDEYYFSFGLVADAGAGSTKLGAVATPAIYRQNVGIQPIAPQSSLVMHFWFAGAATGVTMEVEGAMYEVPAYPA